MLLDKMYTREQNFYLQYRLQASLQKKVISAYFTHTKLAGVSWRFTCGINAKHVLSLREFYP